MPKRAEKKKPRLVAKHPELLQLSATKSALKKIKRGHQEVQRLVRALVSVRAATERELAQFTNAEQIKGKIRNILGADDTLEAKHG